LRLKVKESGKKVSGEEEKKRAEQACEDREFERRTNYSTHSTVVASASKISNASRRSALQP